MNSPEMKWWLQSFQAEFNELTESEHLRFDMVVWNPKGKQYFRSVRGAPVEVYEGRAFPYLDVEMSWDDSDELRFDVYKKEDFDLKYIDKQSTHTSAMKAGIHKSVLYRLTSLMTLSEELADLRLIAIYGEDAAALKKAGVEPKQYPTLREAKELWDKDTLARGAGNS